MMMSAFLLVLALSAAPQSACTAAEHDALDFWTGEWVLTWPGGQGGTPEGEVGRGTNRIARTHGGCVIEEHFASAGGFEGTSVSVYHAATGAWRQTWVDNAGGYLLFSGGPSEDGTMELRTPTRTHPETGAELISRMRWTDISPDALTWHWQRSGDGGATWTEVWTIRYTRE